MSADGHRLAERAGIAAQPALPEAIAHDDDPRGAAGVGRVGRADEPAQERTDAEEVVEADRRRLDAGVEVLAARGDAENAAAAVERDGREDVLARDDRLVRVDVHEAGLAGPRVGERYLSQTRRIAHRQRPQYERIEDAEERCAGADGKRQRQDDDRRDAA